jgi:hypothetical protein
MLKTNARFSIAIVLASVFPVLAHADRSTDREQVRLMIERAHLQVRAELDARLEAEARAPVWAARLERRITRRLLALDGFDSQSLSVTCKSTFCRVEVDPYTDAQEAQLAEGMWAVFEDLPDIKPTISRITMNVRYYLLHATKFEWR